jgi:GR25 family glycosyltransferase involved in LPS biosynthesis
MTISILDVFVIRTPGSARADWLIQSLGQNSRIRLVLIEAVMIKTWEDMVENKLDVDENYFELIEGRKLSFREIGCAASHNEARLLAAQSTIGGVILEDDARIQNIDEFIQTSLNFLNEKLGFKEILSLTPITTRVGAVDLNSKSAHKRWLRLKGQAPLAVGYAITREAASELIKMNTPLKCVADWPRNSCRFYVLSLPLVIHGDESTQSTIDIEGTNFRNSVSFSKKFARIFFFSYVFGGRGKVNVKDYFYWVYLRRFYWLIDNFYIKIQGKL